MKSVSISGSRRENVGKKDAKSLRIRGLIPCVVYGGKEQIHFTVEVGSFKNLVYTPLVQTVDLDIAGKKIKAILQDIQFHPVYDHILHVDFMEIFDNKPVFIKVPTKTVGTAPGILMGGKLLVKMRQMKIKALPKDLPNEILVDINGLNIGSVIKVSDMKVEGVQFLDYHTNIVATVRVTRNVVTEADAAAPAAGAATPAAGAAAPATAAAKPAAAATKPAAKPAAKK